MKMPASPAAATRRHFLHRSAMGLGGLALASLIDDKTFAAAGSATRGLHHIPRAKRVIYLFMAGGPSQLELFDYKPRLNSLHGKPIPDSYLEGKRFAFMDTSFKQRSTLLGSRRIFQPTSIDGLWISDLLPQIAGVARHLTFVRSCATDLFNHAPAKLFMNAGSGQFGRPSLGAWVSYGLGSESQDLPGFVVLQSGPRGPRGGPANWTHGFLPSIHQGVPLRSTGDPILHLSAPEDLASAGQRRALDTLRELNLARMIETGDPEIATRIANYELAFRMQTSAPEFADLQGESPATLQLYGVDRDRPSFARNCLLARRLAERGVRFIQLYHADWDSHGAPGQTLEEDLVKVAHEVDQPCAALIRDLHARGMLDDTLVIWGGEFGRTPMGEVRERTGRNHHIEAFTMWFAGGGMKAGAVVGETDELGFHAVQDRAHVHDLHATLLHLLGIDHERLTFRFQGRDFRLTDVHGDLLPKLMA
ncbi:MAG: DUF1501 domain-containing protein [Verrucomicrobia bacterium]|nr:DUF1501 domain-containing protein [Verrucomicrobiota bacterium]